MKKSPFTLMNQYLDLVEEKGENANDYFSPEELEEIRNYAKKLNGYRVRKYLGL